jgi:hypothetical protein
MINRCIDMGVVLYRTDIEHLSRLGLGWDEQAKAIKNMENENFSRLIELIHQHDFEYAMSDDSRLWDQGDREEREIKELLKDFLWDDVEPCVKEEWRKEFVRKLF